MAEHLVGKAVIVTGAGRGIGRAIAERLAADGANVVLVARSAEQLEEVASAIRALGHGAALCNAVDLRESESAERIVRSALEAFGSLYGLVNNAGTNRIANFVMAKEQDIRDVYEVNVFAAMRLTKLAVRTMIAAKSGRVVNISSIAAKYGAAYNSAYSSSKAALLGFTRSLARETARIGITVNAICPWHVDTELVREAMAARAKMVGKDVDEYLKTVLEESPQRRLIEASEVAALVAYLVSHDARGITGQSLNVCGGVTMS